MTSTITTRALAFFCTCLSYTLLSCDFIDSLLFSITAMKAIACSWHCMWFCDGIQTHRGHFLAAFLASIVITSCRPRWKAIQRIMYSTPGDSRVYDVDS